MLVIACYPASKWILQLSNNAFELYLLKIRLKDLYVATFASSIQWFEEDLAQIPKCNFSSRMVDSDLSVTLEYAHTSFQIEHIPWSLKLILPKPSALWCCWRVAVYVTWEVSWSKWKGLDLISVCKHLWHCLFCSLMANICLDGFLDNLRNSVENNENTKQWNIPNPILLCIALLTPQNKLLIGKWTVTGVPCSVFRVVSPLRMHHVNPWGHTYIRPSKSQDRSERCRDAHMPTGLRWNVPVLTCGPTEIQVTHIGRQSAELEGAPKMQM